MRTETLWQGERRAARMHWWRQVLDRPSTADRAEVFDEALSLRFEFAPETELSPLRDSGRSLACWV